MGKSVSLKESRSFFIPLDNDGYGDACDLCTDTDSDGFGDPGYSINTCAVDNCPVNTNPAQADFDGDGAGDVCDDDDDNDGLNDVNDSCPFENATGLDADMDGCIDTFEGLAGVVGTDVSNGIIGRNLSEPLISKIENAEKSSAKGNICAAVNQLGAFKNQIEAKRGKGLSGEIADQLIQYANNIITQVLQCSRKEKIAI